MSDALKKAPEAVREVVQRALDGKKTARMTELERYRDAYHGGADAEGEKYHTVPARLSEEVKARIRRLRRHVNVVKPAVRYLVGQVYGGVARRTIAKNPYQEELQPFVDSFDYSQKIVTATRLAYLYGNSFAVSIATEPKKPKLWLPNPVYTVAGANRSDIDDLEWLYELVWGEKGEIALVRFVVKGHIGHYDKTKDELKLDPSPTNYLPLTINYGDSRESEGYLQGESLVTPCVGASFDLTHNEMMIKLLRDMQTANIITVWGNPVRGDENQQSQDIQQQVAFGVGEKGEKLGDLEFKSPQTKIADVLELSRHILETLSSQTGIPLDVFRPAMITGSDASAQSARTRLLPLQQTANLRLEQARQFESDLIEAMTAVLTYEDKEGEIDIERLRAEIECEIKLQPEEPISFSEEVASTIQLVNERLMPRRTAIEKFNPEMSPADVDKLLAESAPPAPTAPADGQDSGGGADVAAADTPASAQIFGYHLQFGVATINEVRARIGLPPVPWGDVTYPEWQTKLAASKVDPSAIADEATGATSTPQG